MGLPSDEFWREGDPEDTGRLAGRDWLSPSVHSAPRRCDCVWEEIEPSPGVALMSLRHGFSILALLTPWAMILCFGGLACAL